VTYFRIIYVIRLKFYILKLLPFKYFFVNEPSIKMLIDLFMLNFNLEMEFKVKFCVFRESAALVCNKDVVSDGNSTSVLSKHSC
jgi:hypothetical protein